ncbi:MAG: hypothetical protein P8011_06065 [Acidihalobacter sp.]|uniref:hypothetical protein n=1 Tax=Acidihalobacter sp. TaxID=1872108 RepID=UPI00307DE935
MSSAQILGHDERHRVLAAELPARRIDTQLDTRTLAMFPVEYFALIDMNRFPYPILGDVVPQCLVLILGHRREQFSERVNFKQGTGSDRLTTVETAPADFCRCSHESIDQISRHYP